MFKVQKKDGTTEDFDRNKILSGVTKSGATLEEAEKVTAQIEGILSGMAVNGVVQAVQLRAKVLEVLKTANPTAAAAFENYQKPVAA